MTIPIKRFTVRAALPAALLAAFALLAGAALVRANRAAQPREEAPVAFREHTVASLPGAYQCAVADIDGDGKPDILGLSSGVSEVAWYANPGWKKRLITTQTVGNIDLAAQDLNGDGKLEVAIASEFDLNRSRSGGRLQWFQRDADDMKDTKEWIGHQFGRMPTAHRLRWADWDGDGRRELVVAPILGEGAIAPDYSVPASLVSIGFSAGRATSHLIDRSLTVLHGIRVLDFDGDGRDDLLTASFEGISLFQPVGRGAQRTWKKTQIGAGEQSAPPKRGSSEVDRGRFPGRRSFLAAIEPWHGNEVVVYTPPSDGKGLWKRTVIDTTLEDGHALVCVDLDGDGKSEIVAGFRGGAHNLYGYRCLDADGAKWERFVIDSGGMAGSCVVTADINGDGRPDIVCCGSATGNLKWYENLGPTKSQR